MERLMFLTTSEFLSGFFVFPTLGFPTTSEFLAILALYVLVDVFLEGPLHYLFGHLKLEVRCLFHCLPVENRDDDRALEHLTEEQWQKHALAYTEYLYRVGRYRNFKKGFSLMARG
jgi:hypothetical protein